MTSIYLPKGKRRMSDASTTALLAAALIASTFGMAWLALAKPAHWLQVRGAEPLMASRQRVLRMLGVTSLGASLLLCLFADHPSMAALVWIMSLAAAALSVAFAFAWRSHWVAWTVG